MGWELALKLLVATAACALSGCGVVHLAGSADSHRQYWSAPQGQPGGLRYVALGDSAAQGVGASDPQRGYVGLIAERLRQASGQPVEVINISRSGARIRDVVRDQVPLLDALHADFVTIDVGGNDIGDWNPAEFAIEAVALCSSLPPTKSVIADVPAFMHGKWADRSKQAAEILSRECTARGITIAPLYAVLESRGLWGMFTLYAADWFHPNDRGHKVWASTFWDAAMRATQLRAIICGEARIAQPGTRANVCRTQISTP